MRASLEISFEKNTPIVIRSIGPAELELVRVRNKIKRAKAQRDAAALTTASRTNG